MLTSASNYMKDGIKYLTDWEVRGHDFCMNGHWWDTSHCEGACEDWKDSDFAKKCREKGGLFKCCIR